jgi:SAM-dependent methyltransferase
MSSFASTERFTNRADVYARYRPGYPDGVIDVLRDRAGLQPHHVIADVGAGTGLFSALFVRHGYRTLAVEPNAAMRAYAEDQLGQRPNFESIVGTAEATGLGDASVDFITVGSAFHWFDAARTRPEFVRILRPGGLLVLGSHQRRVELGGVAAALEEFLQRHRRGPHPLRGEERRAAVAAFYGGEMREADVEHSQRLDVEGLRGLALSYSSLPMPGEEGHEALMADLEAAFAQHQHDGFVDIAYRAHLTFGPLALRQAEG